MGITLTVEGLVISGDLIAASRWVAEVGGQPGIGFLEPLFTKYQELYEQADEEEQAAMKFLEKGDESALKAHDEKYPAPEFIHLKKSETYGVGEQGKSIPSNADAYWRGRLSTVSGWTLGRLSPAPAQ